MRRVAERTVQRGIGQPGLRGQPCHGRPHRTTPGSCETHAHFLAEQVVEARGRQVRRLRHLIARYALSRHAQMLQAAQYARIEFGSRLETLAQQGRQVEAAQPGLRGRACVRAAGSNTTPPCCPSQGRRLRASEESGSVYTKATRSPHGSNRCQTPMSMSALWQVSTRPGARCTAKRPDSPSSSTGAAWRCQPVVTALPHTGPGRFPGSVCSSRA
jgi:hypothetical protein